jgi:hypothetical protein
MWTTPPAGAGSANREERSRPTVRTAWTALVVAALVLAGGLEIHPAAELHDPVASLSRGHQDAFFPGASHPAERPHAEAARAMERPLCAACLTQLQGRGAPHATATLLGAPLAGPLLPAGATPAPARQSLRPDGARAPPLS